MAGPFITGFGDGSHNTGETGLSLTGAGMGPRSGTLHMYQNADRTGADDTLTVGSWTNNLLSSISIPGSPNNSPGTVYAVVERYGDHAFSNSFEFTLIATGDIVAPSGDLVLSSSAPLVTKRSDHIIPTGDLVLSSQPPVVEVSAADEVVVPSADLTLSSSAPAVTKRSDHIIPTGNLTLSSEAPIVSTATGTQIAVPSVQLVLSSEAPSFAYHADILVPTGQIVLSSAAPAVTKRSDHIIPTGDLVLTSDAPDVVLLSPGEVMPGSGQLTLSSSAPTVTVTQPTPSRSAGGRYGGRIVGRPYAPRPERRREKPKPKQPDGKVIAFPGDRFLVSAPPKVEVKPTEVTLRHVANVISKANVELGDTKDKISAEIRSFAEAYIKNEEKKAARKQEFMVNLEQKILVQTEQQSAVDQDMMTALLFLMLE